MNIKQALQALVDGKKIRGTDWVERAHIVLSDDGSELIDEYGCEYELGHMDGPDFELYVEKKLNPHVNGTFAWARFESEQNNRIVKRPFCVQRQIGLGNSHVTLADLDATNWTVVS